MTMTDAPISSAEHFSHICAALEDALTIAIQGQAANRTRTENKSYRQETRRHIARALGWLSALPINEDVRTRRERHPFHPEAELNEPLQQALAWKVACMRNVIQDLNEDGFLLVRHRRSGSAQSRLRIIRIEKT